MTSRASSYYTIHLMLAAELVSFVGYGAFFVFNLWLAMTVGGAGGVSAALLANILPSVLLAPFIGAMVDRHNRARIASISNCLRGFSFLFLSYAISSFSRQLALVIIASFVMGLGELCYSSSRRALAQEVSGSSDVVRTIPKLVVASQVGTLIGTVGAGFAAAQVPSSIQYLALSCIFLMSGAILSPLVKRSSTIRQENETFLEVSVGKENTIKAYWDDIVIGAAYTRRNGLIYIFLFPILLLVYLRLITAGLVPFVQQILAGGPITFGIIDASFAIGAIVGASALSAVMSRLSLQAGALMGLLFLGGSTLLFQSTQSFLSAVALHALMGVFYQVSTAFHIVAQERTETLYQGRTASLYSLAAAVISILVYALSAFELLLLDAQSYYLAAGATCLAACVALTFKPVDRKPDSILTVRQAE